MALTTYAGLQASAAAWLERTGDTTVTAIIADCIVLLEAKLNGTPGFRLRDMEDSETITLTTESGNLPADFLAAKRVVANTTNPAELTYADPGWYSWAYNFSGTNDSVQHFTIIGGTIRSKSTATLGLDYYAKIPPLATTDPNWLLTKAPNVYLFGTLLEICSALSDDEGAIKWGTRFSGAVQELMAADRNSRAGNVARRSSMPAF